ncbi:hypothetical protein ACSSS7_001568 [Eimeria intestinalis]
MSSSSQAIVEPAIALHLINSPVPGGDISSKRSSSMSTSSRMSSSSCCYYCCSGSRLSVFESFVMTPHTRLGTQHSMGAPVAASRGRAGGEPMAERDRLSPGVWLLPSPSPPPSPRASGSSSACRQQSSPAATAAADVADRRTLEVPCAGYVSPARSLCCGLQQAGPSGSAPRHTPVQQQAPQPPLCCSPAADFSRGAQLQRVFRGAQWCGRSKDKGPPLANAPPPVAVALVPEAAIKQASPQPPERGEAPGASAAAGPAAAGNPHGAQQDAKGSEPVEPEGQQHLRYLADVAAFRIAARPQEPKGAQQPGGRSGPPGFGGLSRALSGGSKEAVATPPQLEGGAAEVSRAPQPQRGPPEFRSRVNSCPDLQALHAARQRLVSLVQQAGPDGLPLSQVLQRHLCTFNSLLEPHALGFDDLEALVRSAWPALQLRAGGPKEQQPLQEQQQQEQQQQNYEKEQSAPGQQGKPHNPEEVTEKAIVCASQEEQQEQQQQQEREQQLAKEQKQEHEHPSQGRQKAGELSLAPAAAAACSGEKPQEQPQPPAIEELEGSVVVYVRPLLSPEAHLFSNLLFALIADAAEQHQQQQEALARSAGETSDSPKEPEAFSGVPFAALPRLWQEKYSALADLRHFQVAAGARDLCAFLEGLPEVTLQRKQGALLLSLVEGVAVPEGPQYIPNELRRPALAAGRPRPVGVASAALMQLPIGHAPAAALLPGPTLLQQLHRRAAAATPVDAASGPQQQQQQQRPPWQPSDWSLDSPIAPLVGGQQLSLQAAQALLKHLKEQQQAAPEQQDKMRTHGVPHQQPAGTQSPERGRALLQPTSQQQQQELQLQRLLREAVEGLEDGGVGRRHPKSASPVDATAAFRDARQGPVSAALQQAQHQQQQPQAAVAGVLAELLATQRLSRADPTTELQRHLAVPQQQQHQQQQEQQQQVLSANNAGRLQLRRRLLSFVRAACKQQRQQWHQKEDLSEMLISKQQPQQQQQQQPEPADDINPQLRQQLLLLLQLDSQLQQLLQQQQQQASEQASTKMSTASPAAGQEQTRGAAAAAVRRYLLRLLGSPAIAAARSRHRLRTAGMAVSAVKQLWKHQYGESLSQRLEEAGVTFGELVETEPQLFVLGSGRSLRIATRQHLEEFGLLQLPAAAPAQAASFEVAHAEGTSLAAKTRVVLEEKMSAVSPQALTEQQRQRQLLLLLLQQMQHLQQQQQQQQQSSTESFSRLQEPQQQQHQQQPAPLHRRDQQEQTLQLLQRLLSGSDSRGPAGNRAGVTTLSERPQDAEQSPAVTSNASTHLGSIADYTRSVAPLKTNVQRQAAPDSTSSSSSSSSSSSVSLRMRPLVYVLVAKLCQQQHAKHLLLRMQCEAPLQQEQPHVQLLQQQGRWKAAQDAKTLAENGIVGVPVSDIAAEWRRLYGCDLEAPMRHSGYANVLSLVSAVPGLFLVGEGLEARCLVALPAAGQGQQRGSAPIEEPHAGGKTALLSLGGGCDHLKTFAREPPDAPARSASSALPVAAFAAAAAVLRGWLWRLREAPRRAPPQQQQGASCGL